MRKGLVVRDPVFRIMNQSFRGFLMGVVPPQTIEEWEQERVRMPWGTMRAELLTVLPGVATFLFFTQQALFQTWMAYASGFAAAISALVKLFGGFQRSAH